MFSISLVTLALAFVAPSAVNAHGYVQSLEIGGKSYSGWLPFTDPYADPVPQRIVRKIPGDGPILDVTSADLACNQGGETGAPLVATAAAGSQVVFEWTAWPADHLGPVSTYMASCNGDCTTFDTSSAKWFKVDAGGYTNGVWASTQLINNGNKWTSTIPSELKAGEYLMRNEIVALHDAGAPQFYPSCAQVKVTGSGTTEPSGSELVSIPGLYAISDFPDIWADSFKSFTIPGPAPAFSSSSSSSSGDSGSASSSSATHASSSATHASSTHVSSSAAVTRSASSTRVSTTAPATSAAASQATTSIATSSASVSTGRCSSKRRRGMVKRRVSHHAKRHHH